MEEALAELHAAVEAWHGGEVLDGADEVTAVQLQVSASGSMLALADNDFESFAANTAPPQTGDAPAWKDAFQRWVGDKTAASKTAEAAYLALAADEKFDKAPTYRVAAMARVGQLYQRWTDELFTLPIPDEVRQIGQDGVDAYCDALDGQAEALEKAATEAYRTCVHEAVDLHETGLWPEKCRHQFNAIRPGEEP